MIISMFLLRRNNEGSTYTTKPTIYTKLPIGRVGRGYAHPLAHLRAECLHDVLGRTTE
jgi:hypothetical protein